MLAEFNRATSRADSAVIWARADRPARMQVECATDESFKTILRAASADALPDSDFTAKLLLDGLPAGQDIFYRVQFEDSLRARHRGRAAGRAFPHRASERASSVSFVWSGDTAGQGWGIDPVARRHADLPRPCCNNRPDFFIHSGDHIYADCPVPSEAEAARTARSGATSSPRKNPPSRETLAQFRGNYKYNLLDENLRAFNAEVPMFAQWDDHEVTNDWSPSAAADATGYAEDGTSRLVARGTPRVSRIHADPRRCPREAGRVYRKIAYGPLLDVFMIDMRSYRDST